MFSSKKSTYMFIVKPKTGRKFRWFLIVREHKHNARITINFFHQNI